jgi:hypothetical protein
MCRILSGGSCYLSKFHRLNPQLRTVRNLMFPVAILSVGLTESCQDYHYGKFTETITNVTCNTEAFIIEWTWFETLLQYSYGFVSLSQYLHSNSRKIM